jgi:uncharacterized membrane protein YgcG
MELGQFEQNNGVLMVIAKNDRKYSIELALAWRVILTNDFCG